MSQNKTIAAPATPNGRGAIAVIRVSGDEAFTLSNNIFKGKNLLRQNSHTIHYGSITDGDVVIDDVVVSLFKAPKSFTKEDVVEISCHGSPYIVDKILKLLIREGATAAKPGEFTQRAFLNGRFDLAQAEAVADLIASDSESSHQAAINQMRGGFSEKIRQLREELIHFASMIELELDFVEEDVEFADREQLKQLIYNIKHILNPLIESFDLGNVLKNGIPTVIAGRPNAGKSTLLNALAQEEKAIVTEIPGTTRDFIEDEINIGGVAFRFVDTAGLRETVDKIESMGVERTYERMKKASLIIYLFDVNEMPARELNDEIAKMDELDIPYLLVGNKTDLSPEDPAQHYPTAKNIIFISAHSGRNMDALKEALSNRVQLPDFKTGELVVTNVRHYENLVETQKALDKVLKGLDEGITGDFLAMDIRHALHYLGEITGEITTDDLLDNIFSKFCIGK